VAYQFLTLIGCIFARIVHSPRERMIKPLIPALLIMAALASCSTLKPIQSGKNQVATPVRSTSNTTQSSGSKGKDVKFLDDISINSDNPDATITGRGGSTAVESRAGNSGSTNGSSTSVEKASALQLKYAILLNTDVEMLSNSVLLEHVDNWYGTRYRMGGTTKSGIDCSAFTQAIYLSAFAVSLPRTAREQYRAARIISATELKEGDLVFFNTTGGISHVGIYLQNNKFVHASSKQGVTISDMFDPYYIKHYIGAGRIEKPGRQENVIE
jgi:cell wall-associated NlpC family hydrolase